MDREHTTIVLIVLSFLFLNLWACDQYQREEYRYFILSSKRPCVMISVDSKVMPANSLNSLLYEAAEYVINRKGLNGQILIEGNQNAVLLYPAHEAVVSFSGKSAQVGKEAVNLMKLSQPQLIDVTTSLIFYDGY